MKHSHAEIIKRLADDDSQTLWWLDQDGNWEIARSGNKILFIAERHWYEFHLGPTPPQRMVHTECGAYPMPLSEAPAHGTWVWIANTTLGEASSRGTFNGYLDYYKSGLHAGLMHLTKEAAEQQAKVELALRMKRHQEAGK